MDGGSGSSDGNPGRAPFHRSLIELLGVASVLAAAGALLAQYIVRRIERSIASLSRAAESLNCGFPPITRAAGIREIEQVGTALADAAERRRVLVGELQHRTRNLMAIVQSIAHQTLDTVNSLEEFENRFSNRLAALSRVQSLLSRADDGPITLGALVVMELEALGSDAFRDQIIVGGPEVPLRKSSVETLSLAIHELLTNAIKYSALASATGHLSIIWRIEDRCIVLEWVERGIASPQAAEARRSGYGRTLIEEALPYSLSAKTKFDLGSDTLRCRISLPLT